MAAPTRYDGLQAGPPLDITFNPIEKQAFHWFKVGTWGDLYEQEGITASAAEAIKCS